MKKLFSIIAVALAVTVWCVVPAMATKIDVGGELRARGVTASNYYFAKNTDANWLDARLRLDTKIQQGMSTAFVQLDYLNGSTSLSDGQTTGNLILGNGTGNSYALLGVRQAYLMVNFPVLNLIAGRKEIKLGNGIVLNDTSDLAAVTAPIGPVNLLVGYLVLAENDSPFGGSPTSPTSDSTAWAVNAGLNNVGGSGLDADLFVVLNHASGPSTAVGPSDLSVIGLTGNAKVGPAAVGAELDLFGGDASKTSKYKGTNLLLTGGLPAGSVGLPVGLNAAIIYASGTAATSTSTDTNINAIDGDFHASNILVNDDFNNYGGVSSLSGATGGLGLKAIKVSANLPTMKGGGMTHNPEIGLVWAQTAEKDAQGDNDLGTEIYLNTNCVVDPNLSANVGIAFVSAGDALSATTTKPEDQLKLEASLTFKF